MKQLLRAGAEAVEYTKSKVKWSTKHGSDIFFSGGMSVKWVFWDARGHEDELLEDLKKRHGASSITYLVQIAARARAAEKAGAGNCGENAAVAFMWLYRNRPSIRPLDYCDRPGGDHGFVVIGSPVAPKLGNHRTWWTQAVVCDPFYQFAFSGQVALRSRYGSTNVRSLYRVVNSRAPGHQLALSVMRVP